MALVAAFMMFAIMVIVAADVAMRYIFNSPFPWAYDLISLYLMGALFYFALSRAFAEGAHISVDILQYSMSENLRRVCQIMIALIAALFFGTIAYLGLMRAIDDFSTGDATAGAILWPTWLSVAFVPIGSAMITVRLIFHALAHTLSLSTGRNIISLPALAGTAEGAAHGGFE
jgi:TRAP-type C4-dicarboxylate transport system permease small subunit